MTYTRLTQVDDLDIAYLNLAYQRTPYLSIDPENFWNYATHTTDVFFYKAYKDDKMVGAVQCEMHDAVLCLAVLVFPEYQRSGIGTEMLLDIISGNIPLPWEKISVTIDKSNIASVKLFEKTGFVCRGMEDDLLEYIYIK